MKYNKLLLMQIGSALLTFVVYASLLNWKIALFLMFGVGFHELCHLYVAKARGMQTGGFFLMPFIGGVALVGSSYKSRWDQALVVLAGPFGGGAMAALFALIYLITGSPVIGTAAIWMLFLNLFNLLPISFMDGGQLMGTITYTISRKIGLIFKAASLVVGLVLLFKLQAGGVILFIAFFGGTEVFNEFKNYSAWKRGQTWLVPDSYLNQPEPLTKKQLLLTITGYLVTAVMWFSLIIYLVLSLKNLPDSMSNIFQ